MNRWKTEVPRYDGDESHISTQKKASGINKGFRQQVLNLKKEIVASSRLQVYHVWQQCPQVFCVAIAHTGSRVVLSE